MSVSTPEAWQVSAPNQDPAPIISRLISPCYCRVVLGDINPRDGEGMTPLMCAAQYGKPRHILLMNEGNSPLSSQLGIIPLYFSFSSFLSSPPYPPPPPPLPTAVCDFSAVDIEGKTVLHWTAENTDPSCIHAVIDCYPPLLNQQYIP